MPLNIVVPVPVLVNPRLLDPSDKAPLNVVLELPPPAVNVAGVFPLLVTVPLPANEPTALEYAIEVQDRVNGEGRVRTERRS